MLQGSCPSRTAPFFYFTWDRVQETRLTSIEHDERGPVERVVEIRAVHEVVSGEVQGLMLGFSGNEVRVKAHHEFGSGGIIDTPESHENGLDTGFLERGLESDDAVSVYDGNKTIYFVHIDREGESTLFNIKDGGTKDLCSEDLRIIQAGCLIEALGEYSPESILHFESGTINFTVNSIYEDSEGCICLESNEIMELDDYPVGLLMEDLSHCPKGTGIYFYDDDSQ